MLLEFTLTPLPHLLRTDFISKLLDEQSISIRKQFSTSLLRR